MSSRHLHHLVQHCQATPTFLEKSAPAHDAHKRGSESSSALCEHHLKDIRAELKAKVPPNYLPKAVRAFPGTALVHRTPLTAHSGMGFRGLLALFSKRKVLMERGQEKDRAPSPRRGAVSLGAGHEGNSSAHSHHTSSPQRGPPGPEDNLVLSPGVLSAPAALQSARSSTTPTSCGHLTSALCLDCYLHAPDALCCARGCRAASHLLTTLCHSQQPNLWLLLRPVPCTQPLHQLHPLHLFLTSHLPLDLKKPLFSQPHGLSFPGTPILALSPRAGAPWGQWDPRCGRPLSSPLPGCRHPPGPAARVGAGGSGRFAGPGRPRSGMGK